MNGARSLCWLLFLGLQFVSVCEGQGLATWTIRQTASGVSLLFSEPVSLEGIRLPAVAPELWGRGRRGTIAALESNHAVGVAVPETASMTLFGIIADASATRLDIVPVYSDPEPESISSGEEKKVESPFGQIQVVGTSAEQKRLEIALKSCLQEEVDWQRRRGCFSCHRLLPLGLAVKTASERKMNIPLEAVRELLQNLTEWQNSNGAWYFRREPQYGTLTGTLTAVAVMGWWEELNESDGSVTLLKGLAYLADKQLDDGGMVFDFSFPPLFYGRAAAGWLLLNGLVFGRKEVERCGRLFPDRLQSAQKKLQNWFPHAVDHAWRKLLFIIMAGHLTKDAGVPSGSGLSEFLIQEVRQLGFPPELPISALVNLALRAEGRTLLPRRLFLGDRPTNAVRFWELLDGLLREAEAW